uniref:HAD-superfamily hydrolase, subfamily IIB n=1 Tax=Candidatus Kentrum sp. MB TaxID=2138164 RepID=A0A451BEX2_9GAMM|nr:MAG: HAD-superfamily hydrolase, subfamily IIB [Candidatus Kentron sp. MB]VFK34672.1 MAG: HAD-superfamily hydrolase, subfamily IIB [Candidatus Kentron sp. MB]VFK76827.1 MAG: HAD-superfamily hydrolase, subfamily IIB [Candidatus Kentron sp. MB]
MGKIILFMDLDNTIFQTLRKNPDGVIPATKSAFTDKGSYMTQAQGVLFELFHESEKVIVIPTTARDLEQYNNTLLSNSSKIETAILYFSGMIIEKGREERQWRQQIRRSYQALERPIFRLYREAAEIIDDCPLFVLYNVDDYYVSVKARHECEISRREDVFSRLRSIKTEEYYIHQNGRALSFLPKFLDKKFAVQYLIEKYQPDMTLGIGDSLTDLSFMSVCDFQMFPKNTQIETLLSEIYDFSDN